jgi:hypothetical protein
MRKSIETLTGCVRRLASKETVAWIERGDFDAADISGSD